MRRFAHVSRQCAVRTGSSSSTQEHTRERVVHCAVQRPPCSILPMPMLDSACALISRRRRRRMRLIRPAETVTQNVNRNRLHSPRRCRHVYQCCRARPGSHIQYCIDDRAMGFLKRCTTIVKLGARARHANCGKCVDMFMCACVVADNLRTQIRVPHRRRGACARGIACNFGCSTTW